MKKNFQYLLFAFLLIFQNSVFAQVPNLGSAASFALFTSAGAINNAGPTLITGDLGTDVGAFNGFPPGIVIGQIHIADPASASAAAAVEAAYLSMNPITCGLVIGTTLGNNQTLSPNVYCAGAASVLNGDLILDGQGNPNAVFIFKINGALALNGFANVIVTNGASLCNVYWQINGVLSLAQSSVFRGTALVNGAINLANDASLFGRGLSRAGALNMDDNTITIGAAPIPAIITSGGVPIICQGSSILLSGNDNGGTWNTGQTTPTITVTTAGTYFVTTTNGCGSAISNQIIVTVNPLPTVNSVPSQNLCNGSSTVPVVFTGSPGSTIFNWTNDNTSIGLGASGTGNIASFVAINNGPIPVTATITVIPTYTLNGVTCSGSPVNFTITVNNNTAPIINPVPNQTYCVGSVVPTIIFSSPSSGAVFSWTRTAQAIGLAPTNGVGNVPSFIATNAGLTPLTATFTVMANFGAGGSNCSGSAPIQFTITINPAPTATTIPNQIFCAGANVPLTSFTSPNSGGIISYNWVRTPQQIGLVPTSGTGSVPSYIATNTSNIPIISTFTVTPSFNNNGVICPGSPIQYTVTINPAAQVNAMPNIATCNNTLTGPFNFTTTTPNTVFTWTNSDPTIGLAASGTGNIAAFIAINTGTLPKIATITVTPSFITGTLICTGAPITFTITVTPPPRAICKNATIYINNNGVANLNLADVNGGSTDGTVTISKSAFNCSDVGVVTIILTVTDLCSNTATCSSFVTVIDNIPPVISQGDTCIVIQCDEPIPPLPVITATDNCSFVLKFTLTSTKSLYSQLCSYYTYVITRTWTATDPSGNKSVFVQKIKVQDTIPPIITMIPETDVTVSCDEGATHACPMAMDNCFMNAGIIFTFHYTPLPDACANSYIVVRKWTAGDACGNTSFVTQNVYVVDKDAPELTCPANIVKLSNIPIIVTWPMPKAWDDCDGTLIAKIIKGPPSGSVFLPGTSTLIVFEATDNCDNTSTCSFTVTIQNDSTLMKGSKIEGEIKTMNNLLVDNGEVVIKGTINQFQMSDGNFSFSGIPDGADLEINVVKDDNPLDGVNTLDYIETFNHILGKKALDSPYKILAADVNHSQSLTASDLIQLRKLILHITDRFESSNSWKFVPESTIFNNPNHPFQDSISESIKLANIQNDEIIGFTGIKMGDVNWDYQGAINSNNVTFKSLDKYQLNSNNIEFTEGNQLTMLITGEELELIKGLQFTLEYDPTKLELISIQGERKDINENNFGIRYLEIGKITGSLDLIFDKETNKLFSLNFKAIGNGSLLNAVRLSSNLTKAEAYNIANETSSLELHYANTAKGLNIANSILYQNEPNPFESYTQIRFYLPEEQTASLVIYNMAGQLMQEYKSLYSRGEHTIFIPFEAINLSGAYYYQLNSRNETLTKKMMVIRQK